MEKNNNDKLKLIHLVWLILTMAIGVGVAWGIVVNQQTVNSDAIQQTLNIDVFNMYREEQTKQFKSLETLLKDGFTRIDKRLEKIENNKGD
ncbi:MAG: hypothetical protein ACYSTT_22085 [Planctomycetota bacterium]|jgi:uncharacterized protein HemX